MKILKLRFKNLNSFQKEIEINFDKPPLKNARLTAITGPTGSGKTTILDAICVALFGKTPRLSDRNESVNNLLSLGQIGGFSELIFENRSKKFLTEWRIEKSENSEFSKFGKLIDLDTDETITEKLDEVHQKITEITGFDFDSFRRSVMLAQGDFSTFLKADLDTRREILEALAGIEIYDRLQSALDQKLKTVQAQHQKFKLEFDKIPQVTPEQIRAAEIEIDRLNSESNEIRNSLTELATEKSEEQNRTEANQRLIENRHQIEPLLEIQSEISPLCEKLDLAKKAKQISPELNALKTAHANLDNAKGKFEIATEKWRNAQNDFEISSRNFFEADSAYQLAVEERDRQIDHLNDALEMEIRADAEQNRLKRIITDQKDVSNTIEDLLADLQRLRDDCKKLDTQIVTDRNAIENSGVSENSENLLNRVKIIHATQIEKENALRENLDRENELADRATNLDRRLGDLREQISQSQAEKDLATDQLETAQQRSTEISAEDLRDRQNKLDQLQPIIQVFKEYKQSLNQHETELARHFATLEKINGEMSELQQEIHRQERKIATTQQQIPQHRNDEKRSILKNNVALLRNELIKGEPCPVCGSRKHPLRNEIETTAEKELEQIQKQISIADKTIETERKNLEKLNIKRAEIEIERRNIEQQINQTQRGISTTRTEIEMLRSRWFGIATIDQLSATEIADELKTIKNQFAKIEKRREKLRSAQHNCELANARFENLQNQKSEIDRQITETDREIDQLNLRIDQTKQHLESLKSEYRSLIPSEFTSIDDFENAIENLKSAEQNVSENRWQLDQINLKIDHQLRSWQNSENRKLEIENEIADLKEKIESLKRSADQITLGVSAREAIEKLENSLDDVTDDREHASRQRDDVKIQLTIAQSEHTSSQRDLSRAKQNAEVATDRYQNALNSVGFTDRDAHERSFQNDDWITTTDQRLNEFQSNFDRLNEAVQNDEQIFAEKSFNPDRLSEIEELSAELDDQLDKTQTDRGRLLGSIETMKENLGRKINATEDLEKAKKERDRWEKLHDMISENRLRDFALEKMFAHLAELANRQIKTLTEDRYELRVESVKEMIVIDHRNDNLERPVDTLSGGESFLTSLSLALALSDLSRGRSEIHSLFLDEGFGALDPNALDLAISVLEKLQSPDRRIFLISHVQELTDRILNQIIVERSGDDGTSQTLILNF